jgi:hypothetical protein
MSDEKWIEQQVEDSAAAQQYFEFLSSLRVLARSEHLAVEDRLGAVSHAVEKAVGGNLVDATDWVERVTLGLLKP